MRYLSVCSGIESASAGWEPLGWKPVAFAEVDKSASAVLAHRFPDVPNWGDMTKFEEWPDANVDVLVGGTPCQDYSVAGRRLGMAGSRGQLSLTFVEIAARYRPRFVVWENVPGVLSSNDGRDFARFLGDLSGQTVAVPADGWRNSGIVPGIPDAYGLAYRVLDAQFCRVDGFPRAVPQRRQRVFVVGHLGGWRPSAAALIEPESLRGDTPPRRQAGQGDTRAAGGGAAGRRIVADVASTLDAHYGDKWGLEDQHVNGGCRLFVGEPVAFSSKDHGADASPGVAPTMRAMGHDGSHANPGGQLAVAFAIQERAVCENPETIVIDMQGGKGFFNLNYGLSPTLGAHTDVHAVAFSLRGRDGGAMPEVDDTGAAPAIRAASGGSTRPMVACMTGDVAHTLTAEGFDASEDGTGRGTPMVAHVAPTIPSRRNSGGGLGTDFDCDGGLLHDGYTVRRLSVTECERLQGFPDGWTLVPNGRGGMMADGPRYKMLGNSKAVNVVRWIGMRIAMVDALMRAP